MSIQAFFARPANPEPDSISQRIASDIASARSSLVIAAAWFTDMDLARAFVASRAERKFAIFNQADLNRPGSSPVFKLISDHCDDASGDSHQVLTLGSNDFREGVMHHKVIVVDERIVWTGSYNFTYQARRNYEAILRIDDAEMGRQFARQLLSLHDDFVLWWGSTQHAANDRAFRCCICEKLMPISAMHEFDGSNATCKACDRFISEGVARSRTR